MKTDAPDHGLGLSGDTDFVRNAPLMLSRDGDAADRQTASSRIYQILHCLLHGSPLPGTTDAATVVSSIDAIKAIGANSEQIATAVWLAFKVGRVLRNQYSANTAKMPNHEAASPLSIVAAVVWGLASDFVVLNLNDLVEVLDERELSMLLNERREVQIAFRIPVNEKRFRTRSFFSQMTFNLMREESEGYSKLICLLGDTERLKENEKNDSFIKTVTSHVHALIGMFQLESNKVIEIVLAACCRRIESDPSARNTLCRSGFPLLYRSLLDMFSPAQVAEMTCHILAMYRATSRNESEELQSQNTEQKAHTNPARKSISQRTPQSLLVLLATFVREGRLSLSLVWPRLYPNHLRLLLLHEQYAAELSSLTEIKSNLNLGSGAVGSGQSQGDARSGSFSDRDIFTRFPICEAGPYVSLDLQTIELLLIMLENARWVDVMEFMRLMSEDGECVDVASHPPIARALGNLIQLAIGPAVASTRQYPGIDSAETEKVRNLANHLDELGGVEKGFVESIPSPEIFFSENDPRTRVILSLLALLGPHVRRFPELFQDLCILLADEKYSRRQQTEILLRDVLLPGLFLTQSNPVMPEMLWSVVSRWNYHDRWRLYDTVRTDVPKLYPVTRFAAARASHEVKQIMKRLTVDNASQYCTTIAKITHGQALPVFDALLGIVCGYPADQSSIAPSVDLCSKISALAHDMLIFTLMDKLANDSRSKLKEDGVNSSQWYSNLSLYLSVLLRKTRLSDGKRPSMDPVVHFMFRQVVQRRDPMASVLLTDILTNVAGVPAVGIISDKQVRAHAGGPVLQDVVCGALANVGADSSLAGTILDVRLDREVAGSSAAFQEALISCELCAHLPIGVAQLVASVLNDENVADEQLKLYSGLVDRVLKCQLQLSHFFALPTSKNLCGALRDIGPASLLRDYGLSASSVFLFMRPLIDFLDVFPSGQRNNVISGNKFAKEEKLSGRSTGEIAETETEIGNAGEKQSHMFTKIEGIVSDMAKVVDDRVTRYITIELYLSFWILDLGDLLAPLDLYKTEAARLTSAMAAWDRDRNSLLESLVSEGNVDKQRERRKSHEAEVKRMYESSNALSQEMAMRSARQKIVLDRLKEWRGTLAITQCREFADSIRHPQDVVSIFLGECVLPRCGISANDAAFCSRFPLVLMELDIDAFDIATYFSMLLLAVPARLLAGTEGEAENISSLLRETLELLDQWRLHSDLFDKEGCRSIRSGFKVSSPNGVQRIMTHKEYCDWLFSIHEDLSNSFKHAFMKTEYLMLRNALGALSRVLHVFPKVVDHAKVLADQIEELHKTTLMEDVRTSALALHGRVALCRGKALPQHVFRLRPACKPGNSPATAPETKHAMETQLDEVKSPNLPSSSKVESALSASIEQKKNNSHSNVSEVPLPSEENDPRLLSNTRSIASNSPEGSGDSTAAKKRPRSPSELRDDNPMSKVRRHNNEDIARHTQRRSVSTTHTPSSDRVRSTVDRDSNVEPVSHVHASDGRAILAAEQGNVHGHETDAIKTLPRRIGDSRMEDSSHGVEFSGPERQARKSRDGIQRERDQEPGEQERKRDFDRERERMRGRGHDNNRENREESDRDRERIHEHGERDRYRDRNRDRDRDDNMRDRERRDARYQKADTVNKVERDRTTGNEREVHQRRDIQLDRGPRTDRQIDLDRGQPRGDDRLDHDRSVGPVRNRFDRRDRPNNGGFSHGRGNLNNHVVAAGSTAPGDSTGNGYMAEAAEGNVGGTGRGNTGSGSRHRYRGHRR